MSLSVIIVFVYVGLSLVNVLGEFLRFNMGIRRWTTPLAMPLLMAWVVVTGGFHWPLLIALAAGLAGDILLIQPEDCSDKRFTAAICAFFAGHLIYFWYFLRNLISLDRLPALVWAAIVALAIASGVMFLILRKKLGTLKIPILLYTMVLFAVGTIILLNWGSLPRGIFYRALGGIMLFFISDSFLSMDRFIKPFGASRQMAMATYFPAQFFLAQAIVFMV